MIVRVVFRVFGQKSHDDVIEGILLQHLDIIEHVGFGPETLNEPGA